MVVCSRVRIIVASLGMPRRFTDVWHSLTCLARRAKRAQCKARNLLYFVCDPWPWGRPYETARFHHATRRCGGRMAARGARAAGYHVARRIRPCRIVLHERGDDG